MRLFLLSILCFWTICKLTKPIKKISGHISLSNQLFDTNCSCEPINENDTTNDETTSSVELIPNSKRATVQNSSVSQKTTHITTSGNCKPSQIMISLEAKPDTSSQISPETVKNILQFDSHSNFESVSNCNNSNVLFSFTDKIAIPVTKASFKCSDGRLNGKYFYTLGADFGEFLTALSVYKEYAKREYSLDYNEIKRIFELYLEKTHASQFSFCTDREAIKNIENLIGSYGFSIQNVKDSLKDKVLNSLSDSNSQGCPHIRLLMGEFN